LAPDEGPSPALPCLFDVSPESPSANAEKKKRGEKKTLFPKKAEETSNRGKKEEANRMEWKSKRMRGKGEAFSLALSTILCWLWVVEGGPLSLRHEWRRQTDSRGSASKGDI